MKNPSKIHSTTDYNIFKRYDSNRAESEDFISKLMESDTFEEGFAFNPIIVNEKMIIIDGQHRYLAATRKNIPIYYVIYEGADQKTMIELNVKMHTWIPQDFLFHYSLENEEYKEFKKIKDKHCIQISSMIKLCGIISRREVTHGKFRQGDLKITDCLEKIREFCDKYYYLIKKHRTVIGKKYSAPLFSQVYVAVFARIFRDDPSRFDKILERIDNTCYKFPKTSSPEDIQRITDLILCGKYKNYLEAI